MSGSSKQDPDVKGNPYSATYHATEDAGDVYLVRSASRDRLYFATIHPDDFAQDDCSCEATRRCWHVDAARLMQQIERATANAQNLYRTWSLAELQAEDARLRALLAEADSWLVRSQLGVVGDQVLDRLIGAEVAA